MVGNLFFLSACIVYDSVTRRSRGFGYVLFQDANDAKAAKDAVRGKVSPIKL